MGSASATLNPSLNAALSSTSPRAHPDLLSRSLTCLIKASPGPTRSSVSLNNMSFGRPYDSFWGLRD